MRTFASPVRHHIEQIRIDDELGIVAYNLDEFAAEFGHKVARVYPIFLVFVDGELSAYYYAAAQVVIYPAVNPRCFTPRSFLTVGQTIVAASKQVWGNPLWVVSRDTPMLSAERLDKVFLKPLGADIYNVRE